MKKHPIDDNGSLMTTQSECKSENINVQAAFLHVLGDFIQSIGVIIAAVIIKFYVSYRWIAIQRFMFFINFAFSASSKSRWSAHHVFILHHRRVHNFEDI